MPGLAMHKGVCGHLYLPEDNEWRTVNPYCASLVRTAPSSLARVGDSAVGSSTTETIGARHCNSHGPSSSNGDSVSLGWFYASQAIAYT